MAASIQDDVHLYSIEDRVRAERDRFGVILERLHAMRSHEEPSAAFRDYHNDVVAPSCRTAMIDWCFTVVEAYHLNRESVAMGFCLLDRYLSSGAANSESALRNRQTYQLAAITCFYVAVKIHEPVQLGIDIVVKLCRGYYKKEEIIAIERDVLTALRWRVCASSATAADYARQYFELLPEWAPATEELLRRAATYAELATKDVHFSTCRASVVGAACLAMAAKDALLSYEEEAMARQLDARLVGFDLDAEGRRDVEGRLRSKFGVAQSRGPSVEKSRLGSSRTSVVEMNEQTASPVSVMER